jgi:DNA-binding response OmpR family regulator
LNSLLDVVVLDVKMPGMTGIEVLRNIRNKYPKTEVLLLTGQATASDGVEGIKSGAFDYLTKPIELEHLFYRVKRRENHHD